MTSVATQALGPASDAPGSKTAARGVRGGRVLRAIFASWSARLGAAILFCVLVAAVGAGILAPSDPVRPDAQARLVPPSLGHALGTDLYGRDVLSRLVHGARISIYVAGGSVVLALLMGVPLGIAAGYYGGRYDAILMAALDVVLTFPVLLLAIMIMVTLGPGYMNVAAALTVIRVPTFARIARSKVMSLRTSDFVTAARSLGCPDRRIILRHLVPNTLGPVVTAASVSCGFAILYEGTLSFLGLGTQPPTPSWGYDLKAGVRFLEIAPWLALAPGAAILLSVLGFNLLGEGLNDALDPGARGTRRGTAYQQG